MLSGLETDNSLQLIQIFKPTSSTAGGVSRFEINKDMAIQSVLVKRATDAWIRQVAVCGCHDRRQIIRLASRPHDENAFAWPKLCVS